MPVPNPYPNTLLATHDVRKPDSNPVAGGPYLRGYDPTVVGAGTAYVGDGGDLVLPNGQLDSSRTKILALPSLQGGATFTPGAALLGQESSGDQPGVAYSQVTEDHSQG